MKVLRTAMVAALLAACSWPEGVDEVEDGPSDAEAWQRFSERCSSHSLRTPAEAEADFRPHDSEESRVNDFWTADVSGLYTLTSTDVLMPGTEGALRVIEFTADPSGGNRTNRTAGP